MKAVILVGGYGTRLRPLTLNTPKSIVPVVNIPFLLYQIELLKKHGVKNIVLSLCYKPDRIRRIFGSGRAFGVNIEYSIEDRPLGTCGAAKKAGKYFDDFPVVVLNGDVLTDFDLDRLYDYHKKTASLITLALYRVPDPSQFGLVLTDKKGRISRFLEKPAESEITTNAINAGIYLIEKRIFDMVPAGVNYSFERQLFQEVLAAHLPFYAVPLEGYWLDIGSPAKYFKANRDILENKVNIPEPLKKNILKQEMKGGQVCHRGAGVKCAPGVRFHENAVIGHGTTIKKDVSVTNSIIWDKCLIESGARVTSSIIGSGCVIGKSAAISHAVLGDGSVIADHSRIEGSFE